MTIPVYVQGAWFIGALLFIFGLKGVSSPASARRGIVIAGYGMLIAIAAVFLIPGLLNLGLMLLALVVGGALAWISGKKVQMTDMPQMVAIYNGMGGGAAAAIAAVEFAKGEMHGLVATILAVLGALIGAVSFTGSCVAWAKLQGVLKKAWRLPAQNAVNVVLALAAIALGVAVVILAPQQPELVIAFFVVALVLGLIVTLPIGGADMPVVISLFNAFTGLAVGFEGYVLGNPALIIAGIVVGAAGTLLTQLMAKAMNRPLSNILFTPMVAASSGEAITGTMKEVGAIDAAAMMRYASKVIIVPGYGMAVAHAQQHGFVHGGIVGMIADSAAGYAAMSILPADASVLTVEYKLNLVAPADGELLIARGKVVRPGRTLIVTQAEVYALKGGQEKLCALMQQTIMVMYGKAEK